MPYTTLHFSVLPVADGWPRRLTDAPVGRPPDDETAETTDSKSLERAMKFTVLIIASLLGVPVSVVGQEARQGTAPGPRKITVVAGIGNTLGLLGIQGEFHLSQERFSAFGAVGYLPEDDPGDPSGLALAAGVRGFTPGAKHRGFVELSLSVVAIQQPLFAFVFDATGRPVDFVMVVDGKKHYGPGIQVGYHYVGGGGFTFLASVGVGYAIGADDPFGSDRVDILLALGLGYTWR